MKRLPTDKSRSSRRRKSAVPLSKLATPEVVDDVIAACGRIELRRGVGGVLRDRDGVAFGGLVRGRAGVGHRRAGLGRGGRDLGPVGDEEAINHVGGSAWRGADGLTVPSEGVAASGRT